MCQSFSILLFSFKTQKNHNDLIVSFRIACSEWPNVLCKQAKINWLFLYCFLIILFLVRIATKYQFLVRISVGLFFPFSRTRTYCVSWPLLAEAAGQNCDFEQPGLCKYAQDKSDTFDWTWLRGSTDSVGTGPSNDHTYKGNQAQSEFILVVLFLYYCIVGACLHD